MATLSGLCHPWRLDLDGGEALDGIGVALDEAYEERGLRAGCGGSEGVQEAPLRG